MNKLVRGIKLASILCVELEGDLKNINTILDYQFVGCRTEDKDFSIFYINKSNEVFLELEKISKIFYIPMLVTKLLKKTSYVIRDADIEALFRYKIVEHLNYGNVEIDKVIVDHFNASATLYKQKI